MRIELACKDVIIPSREPDITIVGETGYNDYEPDVLKIWIDEQVEAHVDLDFGKTIYSKIKHENGKWWYYSEDSKGAIEWDNYEDTIFPDVDRLINDFICEQILLKDNTEVGMLTDTQARYIELEKKKEAYKAYLEELKEVTEQLVSEIGIGGHFQDGEGTVYQVADAVGRFVHFDKHEVKRTRRNGERSGSLSLTDAKNLGYEVK